MTAAIVDGGSVQDREYIQRCARQTVDQGLWGNLKLWIDPALPKLRNSGGVDYVPKLYDLSGNGNNGVQTTEAYQPVWGATGLTFDGSDDYIESSLQTIENLTISLWIKYNDPTYFPYFLFWGNTWLTSNIYLAIVPTNLGYTRIRFWNFTGAQDGAIGTSDTADDNWHLHTFSVSGKNSSVYVDGEWEADGTITNNYINGGVRKIFLATRATNTVFVDGSLNDIRIYSPALTATEIAAIYNQTSYRYA